MIPISTKTEIEAYLAESFRTRYKRKDVNITGILFARPELKATQDQVLPNLDHWNYRSDYYTEFFCVGFTCYPPPSQRAAASVVTVAGTQWYFSAAAFNEVLVEIETQTNWRYRSGCYLVITNSRYDAQTQRAYLDFRHAMSVDIARAVSSGAVESADELAERMFEFAKKINEGQTSDPVWEFSDTVGLVLLKKSLIDHLVDLLPTLAKAVFRRGENFVVQELTPSATSS